MEIVLFFFSLMAGLLLGSVVGGLYVSYRHLGGHNPMSFQSERAEDYEIEELFRNNKVNKVSESEELK